MAIYVVNFEIKDEQQRSTNREVLFDVADEATLLTNAALHATDLAAMTKCGIQQYTYRRTVSVLTAPGAGSNIDAGATFRFNSALAISPTVKVPDPVEAIKDGQGGIDLLDVIVTDWFANYNPGTAVVNINNPTQPTSIDAGTLDK
jgi:hypothetical protein